MATRSSQALNDLPYKIHTGRELVLMLEGKKPLAYFSGQYPPNPHVEEIPERLFDPYVEEGRFVKREYMMFCAKLRTLAAQQRALHADSDVCAG